MSTQELAQSSLSLSKSFILEGLDTSIPVAPAPERPHLFKSMGVNLSTPETTLNQNSDVVLNESTQITANSASVETSVQSTATGSHDVLYTFYYVYGNQDFYYGYGYADASQGYYAGQYISPFYDETTYQGGNTGYYYIASVSNYGADYGLQNQVYVTQYYDSETASYASYLYDYYTGNYGYSSSYYGLGNEFGYAYNYSFTNTDSYFGTHYYEADMTSFYA
jgi:hypothetical protein